MFTLYTCVDKPGKSRDYYHSCYALSGLSVAQWGCGSGGDDQHFPTPKVRENDIISVCYITHMYGFLILLFYCISAHENL